MKHGQSGAKREVGTLPGTRTPERHPGRGPRPDRGGHGPRGPADRPPGDDSPPARTIDARPAARLAAFGLPPHPVDDGEQLTPESTVRTAAVGEPGERTVALPVTPPTADPAQAPASDATDVDNPAPGAPATGGMPAASTAGGVPAAHAPPPPAAPPTRPGAAPGPPAATPTPPSPPRH